MKLIKNASVKTILGLTAYFPFVVSAAVTDIAQQPLAQTSSVTVKPNVMFVLDDSGSMAWPFMPDSVARYSNHANDSTNALDENVGFYSHMCNKIYYNPAKKYAPPPRAADQTLAFDNASFVAARDNGFVSSSAPRNLLYDFQADRATPVSASWDGANEDLPTGPAFYYKYVGSSFAEADCNVKAVANTSIAKLTGNTVSFESLAVLEANSFTLNGKGNIKFDSTSATGVCLGLTDLMSTNTTGKGNRRRCMLRRIQSWIHDLNTTTFGANPVLAELNDSTTPSLVLTSSNTIKITNSVGSKLNELTGLKDTATYTLSTSSPLYAASVSVSGVKKWERTLITTAEEKQNFANWYSYYRTRMLMTKSSVGFAFKDITSDYRIAFDKINAYATNSLVLDLNDFTQSHKTNFYSLLYNTPADGSTPLRAALAKAGRYYGNKLPNGSAPAVDPIQYSCQRNFTILSTDGYWNGANGIDLAGNEIDELDKGVSRPSEDKLVTSKTLADVAYYYYHTDLRSGLDDDVPGSGLYPNEDDVAFHQHMTTFTLGLGVGGTLSYKERYKNRNHPDFKSSDYDELVAGTKFWPTFSIAAEGPEKVDDLWHAAVNGRGSYFNASDPEGVTRGITNALASAKNLQGAGTAVGLSNLEPVEGDNFAFVAVYYSGAWAGDIQKKKIDLTTGALSEPIWSGSAKLNEKSSNFSGKIIYTEDPTEKGAADKLKNFTYSELTATELAFFNTSLLSQSVDWTAPQASKATAESLINFIRGDKSFERRDSNPLDSQVYRERKYVDESKNEYDFTLGDIIHSQPVYLTSPNFNYTDEGYAAFKAANNRATTQTVFVQANDGQLHAFNAETGEERWSYVPNSVLKQLYRLADANYPTNHKYILDGPVTVSDVKFSKGWRTILIGALGRGGRGYYALDVTDPTEPRWLWSFSNDNLGLSLGKPLITKWKGTWSVIFGSGYNNVKPGDGKNHIFVLDAETGTLRYDYKPNVSADPLPDSAEPTGLAHIEGWVEDSRVDNEATRLYAGDLHGNLWRVDNDDAGTFTQIASVGEPITVRPEISEVNGKPILFFGTGRLLGQSDLKDKHKYAFYAVRDALTAGQKTVTPSDLVEQIMTESGGTRSIPSSNTIDWSEKSGWYIRLLTAGERVNVDPKLQLGTLVFVSNIPDDTVCKAGGSSWIYNVNYETGGRITKDDAGVGQFNPSSMSVGFGIARLGSKLVALNTFHKGETTPTSLKTGNSASDVKRVQWREIIAD